MFVRIKNRLLIFIGLTSVVIVCIFLTILVLLLLLTFDHILPFICLLQILFFFFFLLTFPQLALDFFDVLFFIAIAPRVTSFATAQAPRHPVLINSAHLAIHKHHLTINLFPIPTIISDLSRSFLPVLNKSVSFRLIGLRTFHNPEPLNFTISSKDTFQFLFLCLVTQPSDENGPFRITLDLLVIVWIVLCLDLLLLVYQVRYQLFFLNSLLGLGPCLHDFGNSVHVFEPIKDVGDWIIHANVAL